MKTKLRLSHLAVGLCFFGFLLAGLMLGLLMPDRTTSTAENRALAQRPALRRVISDFSGFARDFDAYAADQFPGRARLTRIYTQLELAQGKKYVRSTYCLDGWLLTPVGRIRPAQLNALTSALQSAAAEGRPLLYCMLPLKNEVLHDIDPVYFSDEAGAENRQALAAMLSQVDGLHVIDAQAPLLAGSLSEREQFFFKTDYHWNARGAFAASQEIARQLAAAGFIREDTVFKSGDFVWTELGPEKRYQGDLNLRFSNLFSMREDIPLFSPRSTDALRYYLHPDDTEPVPRDSICGSGLNKDTLSYNDLFTYNLGYYRVENPDAPEDQSVLILKDSFQNATLDCFTAMFREVSVVDPRYYQESASFSALLDDRKVDLVFFLYHQNNVSQELIDFLTRA